MKIPRPTLPLRRAMRESFDLGRDGLEKRQTSIFDSADTGNWDRPTDLPLHRRPVIMLAEDDSAMLSLLSSQLRRDGYRVIPCADGTEFVHRVDVFRSHGIPVGVDLVISDVRMPRVSGLDLLALVKEAPLGIPVILISAFGDMEMRGEAAKRDAAAFFSKPFDIDQLRAAVRTNLPKVL
jgi:two-component system response regulator (stage 0 sporulation protein F)